MSRTAALPLTTTRESGRAAQNRLPHPSWRLLHALPQSGEAARITDASDFWQRLGL